VRRFTRTLAAASTVAAIGWFAVLWGDLRFRFSVQGSFYLPHFRLELAAAAAQGAGFLLAAAGFWIAGRFTEPADPPPGEVEMVGAAS
jgi:hypothetical protein